MQEDDRMMPVVMMSSFKGRIQQPIRAPTAQM